MRTKIISAFPGCGKSFYFNNNKDITLDSDSSEFSWILDYGFTKQRHPNFPQNYIDHIKENIGKYDVIFVSTHKEVREALLDNCIYFSTVYPRLCDKEMFKQRYIQRCSDESFIKQITENWTEWIRDLSKPEIGCSCYEWDFSRKNMEDFIKFLQENKS